MTALNVPTQIELSRHLEARNVLSPEHLRARAALLHEDISRLQIAGFRLLPIKVYPPAKPRSAIAVAEYEFGPVQFSIENAKDSMVVGRTVVEMDGTAINKEDLLYLSQVCELGRAVLPKCWFTDELLKSDLRLPTKHLDTLNEVWWLGRFRPLSDRRVEREASLHTESKKTIDWRFHVASVGGEWTINLEVKRLIGSIGAHAYNKEHHFYSADAPDGTPSRDDPRAKFRPSGANEVNILAVTWFDKISLELEAKIQRFLDECSVVDVVAVWAVGDQERGGWMRFFPRFREIWPKRKALEFALVEPNREDHERVIAYLFPRGLDAIRAEMGKS